MTQNKITHNTIIQINIHKIIQEHTNKIIRLIIQQTDKQQIILQIIQILQTQMIIMSQVVDK